MAAVPAAGDDRVVSGHARGPDIDVAVVEAQASCCTLRPSLAVIDSSATWESVRAQEHPLNWIPLTLTRFIDPLS